MNKGYGMTKLSDMKVIETTYELVRPDFIYRVIMGTDYAYIKRTMADKPMWTHGALTHAYDKAVGDFMPMIRADRMRLSVAEADMVLAKL